MAFASFGLREVSKEGQLDGLVRNLPPVRPTTADWLTHICYQTEYGIYDHEKPSRERPLAMVAFHDKEDVLEGGPLYSHIRRFFGYRIGKLFNVSLGEFLSFPLHVVELLYAIGQSDGTQQDRTQRGIARQMHLDLDEED